MRIFEILIAIVLLVVLVVRWIPVIKNKGVVRVLPWTAALLIPLVQHFDGCSSIMIPWYSKGPRG